MKNCNCLLDWHAIDRTSGIGYMIETCNRLNRDQNSHLVRYMKALNKSYDSRKKADKNDKETKKTKEETTDSK